MTTPPDVSDAPPITAHQTLLVRAFQDVLNEGVAGAAPFGHQQLTAPAFASGADVSGYEPVWSRTPVTAPASPDTQFGALSEKAVSPFFSGAFSLPVRPSVMHLPEEGSAKPYFLQDKSHITGKILSAYDIRQIKNDFPILNQSVNGHKLIDLARHDGAPGLAGSHLHGSHQGGCRAACLSSGGTSCIGQETVSARG